MSSLLVIGGSGFFGKSILDAYHRGLLQQWNINSIFILSRNASKLKSTNPDLLSNTVELIDADITCCKSIPFADFVIHAAASSDERRYLESSEEERRNIIAGTYNYINLAKIFHQKSKIIYVSSGAVYGDQPIDVLRVPENYASHDLANSIVQNKKAYALAKRDSENLISKLGSDGLEVSIARCFAFIGPYLPRDQHFAIGNFIEDALHGRAIEVKAQHQVFRSYMYADDLVSWLMTIASSASSKCPIFNVGSDIAVEIRDLALMISEKYAVQVRTSSVIYGSQADRYIPDIQKARLNLGLKINYELDEAISITLARLANK